RLLWPGARSAGHCRHGADRHRRGCHQPVFEDHGERLKGNAVGRITTSFLQPIGERIMGGCCGHDGSIDALRQRQRGTLNVVLVINAVMFVVIVAAALFARSSALLADSLDNLGDAFTYAISLYAVARSTRTKARVALLKGVLILLAAAAVAAQIAYRLLVMPATPVFELMGIFSLLALAANG